MIGFVQEGKAEAAHKPSATCSARTRWCCAMTHPTDLDAAAPGARRCGATGLGDRLPADVRLLDAHNLRVDEAASTGESVPVDKHTQAVAAMPRWATAWAWALQGHAGDTGQGARAVVVAYRRT